MLNMSKYIDDYFNKLRIGLERLNKEKINKIVELLLKAWKEEKQIFILGNGGSASTASHFACDLGKGTLDKAYDNKRRFKVISLTDNVATLTAYANDLSFNEIFSQQLRNLVNKADIVIIITGSGNSGNIIKAVEVAKLNGAITIGFLGFDGGKVKELLDYCIIFNDDHYGRIEDSHLIMEHLICSMIRNKINYDN
jgi:D-sedoheptulose 7-phosphate isomerase